MTFTTFLSIVYSWKYLFSDFDGAGLAGAILRKGDDSGSDASCGEITELVNLYHIWFA